MMWIGVLWLAAGSLSAQTVSLNTSTSLSEPCASAKAVHDMRCPNYTGFKPRVRMGSADDDPARESARPAPSLPEGGTSLLRGGKDLQRGVASWYGPGFHGRTTANGEKFNMGEMTAAHKTLPFGTRVLVHNPRTGKEVVVRINDRGPYARGRVIDLSKAAAHALGMKTRGHDAVVLREVLPARAGQNMIASAETGANP